MQTARVFLSFPTSPNIRVLCGPAPLMGRLLEEGVVTSGQQLSLHSPSSPTEMWPLSLFCREMALPGLQQPQKSPPGACANSLTSVQVALLPSLPPLSIQSHRHRVIQPMGMSPRGQLTSLQDAMCETMEGQLSSDPDSDPD